MIYKLAYFSVKPPRHRRGRGVFGLNTPRKGVEAEEYLNQIHRCQAKARWFYSLYSELQVVFGKLEMVFEIPNCQV